MALAVERVLRISASACLLGVVVVVVMMVEGEVICDLGLVFLSHCPKARLGCWASEESRQTHCVYIIHHVKYLGIYHRTACTMVTEIGFRPRTRRPRNLNILYMYMCIYQRNRLYHVSQK